MNLFDLAAVITLDKSKYEQGLKEAQGQAEGFGSKLKSGLSTAMTAAGTAVGVAATAIVKFGADSVKAGESFDKSMSQVAATMGKTVDEIQDLRDFAQEMGSSTSFSATEAADALNYMALAGYDAETSMKMLPNVLNLAAAGDMALASASDMVTDASSALGLSIDETSELVDKMAKASSKSNTSVAQLGDAILTVGGTAKTMAGGTTELAQVLGILADNGVKGAEGGTALRNIILSLTAPTNTAAGVMRELGLQVLDADGNMRPMKDIMEDLNGSLSSMSEGQKTQVLSELFNKVDLKSVNALLATNVERWDELTEEIDDAQGSAQKMADTQLDNLAGDITLFESALEGAKIAISDELTPTIREFVSFGTDSISKLTAAFKENGLEGAMEVLGTSLTTGIQKVINTLPELTNAGVKLVEAIVKGIGDSSRSISDAAIKIVSTFIRGLGDAAPTIIKSAAEIVLNLALSLTDPENIRELMNATVDLAVGIAEGLVEAIPEIIAAAPVILYNLGAALIENAPRLLYEVPFKIGETIGNGLRNIDWRDVGQRVLTGLRDGMTNFWNVLTGAAEPVVDTVNEVGETADRVKPKLESMVSHRTVFMYEDLRNKADGLRDTVQQWGEETEQAGEFIAWTNDVLDESLRTVENAVDDYTDLRQTVKITADEFKSMRDRVTEYTKEMSDRWDENFKAAYDSMQGQIDLYADMKEASDVSVSKVIENLKKQIDASREYYDNLKTVMDGAKEHGIQISAELQAELQSGSDNAKLIVQELAENMAAGNAEMLADLNNTMNERRQVSADFAQLCAGDYEEVKKNAALMRYEMLELVRSTDGLYNEFHAAGIHAAQGLLDGWNSLSASVTAAVGSTTNSMVRRAHSILQEQSPSKVFRQIGAYAIEGMTLGIKDEGPKAVKAVEDVSTKLIDKTRDLVSVIKQALEGMVGDADAVAQRIANAISNMSNTMSNAGSNIFSNLSSMMSSSNTMFNTTSGGGGFSINYDNNTAPSWLGSGPNTEATADSIRALGWRLPGDEEKPINITVQSVLDGRVIGETAYRYANNRNYVLGRT